MIYRYLEQEGCRYAICLPGNKVLYRAVEHLLKRPVGSPSREPKITYHGFRYTAGTWEEERRVVAKIEWRLGELFPRVGFVVTNLSWWSRNVCCIVTAFQVWIAQCPVHRVRTVDNG